jgi:hypothetical protein
MSLCQLPAELAAWVVPLTLALDARQHPRFAALLAGLLLAKGRRTVSSWIRAAGLRADFRACYGLVYHIGRRAEWNSSRKVDTGLSFIRVFVLRRGHIPQGGMPPLGVVKDLDVFDDRRTSLAEEVLNVLEDRHLAPVAEQGPGSPSPGGLWLLPVGMIAWLAGANAAA